MSMNVNIKILLFVVCITICALLLIGFLIMFEMRRNESSDDENDTTEIVTEMMINSTEILFEGPMPATVISAPKICKDGEKLETKTNTCRKKF
jgi:hypothetical protein